MMPKPCRTSICRPCSGIHNALHNNPQFHNFTYRHMQHHAAAHANTRQIRRSKFIADKVTMCHLYVCFLLLLKSSFLLLTVDTIRPEFDHIPFTRSRDKHAHTHTNVCVPPIANLIFSWNLIAQMNAPVFDKMNIIQRLNGTTDSVKNAHCSHCHCIVYGVLLRCYIANPFKLYFVYTT